MNTPQHADTIVVSLPDQHGHAHRIAIHPPGHYAVDDRWQRQSLMVGSPDGTTALAAPTQDDPFAKVYFPHMGDGNPCYLGYENLWMLISRCPHETEQGTGHACVIPDRADQRFWLTIERLIQGVTTNLSFVGANREEALRLMTAWLLDRAQACWDGDANGDPWLGACQIRMGACALGRADGAAARPDTWLVLRTGFQVDTGTVQAFPTHAQGTIAAITAFIALLRTVHGR